MPMHQIPTTTMADTTKAIKDIKTITMMANTMTKGLQDSNTTKVNAQGVAAMTLKKTLRHSVTSL